MATDVDTLSMAAYSAATARMAVQQGGPSMALHTARRCLKLRADPKHSSSPLPASAAYPFTGEL